MATRGVSGFARGRVTHRRCCSLTSVLGCSSVRRPGDASWSMAGPKFNSDLYVVSATVIPVFFVALMMPGGTVRQSVVRIRNRHREARNDAWVRFKAGLGYLVFVVGSIFLYLLFVVGEVEALTALDNERATDLQHLVVLVAVELMTLVTAVSAVLHVLSEDEKTAHGEEEKTGAPRRSG